jgi:hypothetical protein
MKKQLTMTSAMAAALLTLPACSSNDEWNEGAYADSDTAICVDGDGERVDNDLCDGDHYRGAYGYSYYYFGGRSRIPYYGESVHDRRYASKGAFTPAPGVRYAPPPAASRMTRSQAVSRGGLGSSGRSFGRSGG